MTPNDLESRLKNHFPDADVLVTDLTGTEDHYEVRIASKAFHGRSRIEQQRQVMGALDAELKSGEVHALTIKTLVKD
jgi:stress-induced morphogen